jgi:hypothetical protein
MSPLMAVAAAAGFDEPLAPEEKPENRNGQREHDPEQAR